MNKKQLAIHNDNRIFDLASYIISEGMIKPVTNFDLVEDKFRELKRLVIRGEFTLDQLEESVCEKYGVVNTGETAETPLEALEQISAEFQRRDEIIKE